MTEHPASPKSSETAPPASNQPVGDDEAAEPTTSDTQPADRATAAEPPQVVSGKPDGEVDTRR
jgi:hypothetical protein